jgi:hypothetical protein
MTIKRGQELLELGIGLSEGIHTIGSEIEAPLRGNQ